jgi:hypothetical protein
LKDRVALCEFRSRTGLMEQRDSDPGVLLADKGYDSDAIRQDMRDRGASPEIPTKLHRKVQHTGRCCMDR